MKTTDCNRDAMAGFAAPYGSADTCLFCDAPRQLKHGCQKQRWMVCEKHKTCKCPECGGMAHWMEGMKKGNYYLCFDSLACWWRAANPPNAELSDSRL
jgi:hypothetical protein